VFVVFFYAFFIFDIYGDETGFKRAIWAPIIMIVLPLLIVWLFLKFYEPQKDVKQQPKITHLEDDFPIEMTDRASSSKITDDAASNNPLHFT
jgi:hypothetical protein